MSEATRQRVLAAVRETGYRVNHAARSLRTSRTGVISAVVPKIANPVFEHVVRGIQEQVSKDEGVLMLTDADWLTPDSHLLSRLGAGGMTDGFLVRSAQVGDDTVDALEAMQVPCVVLTGPDGVHPSIWVDDRAGIRSAASFLLELGHRRIALIGGLKLPAQQDSRLLGYVDAYREAGLPPATDLHRPTGYDHRVANQTVEQLLALADPPTAIIVDNILSSLSVYAAIADAGLRIPDDISVIAYHDVAQADEMWPPLTTVRMPLHEVGVQAAIMLKALIDGERVAPRVLEGAELVERASTGAAAS